MGGRSEIEVPRVLRAEQERIEDRAAEILAKSAQISRRIFVQILARISPPIDSTVPKARKGRRRAIAA